MFGYIIPDKPELKIKDFDRFKAYYCGVCHAIGENCGQTGRFFLNYDCTFLAVLLDGVSGNKVKVQKSRCIAHPLKKGLNAKDSNFINYAADINVILAYYKLLDDWHDEKKLIKAAAMLSIKNLAKKAGKHRKEETYIVKSKVNELSQLEKEACSSIDIAAEPFAKLLEGLMFPKEYTNELKSSERQLKWLGYNIGKWIYIIDAFDDIEKDIKENCYNPILRQFEYNNETYIDFRKRVFERVEMIIMNCLNQVALAYEMLEITENKAILDNIIYSGLRLKTQKVLCRTCKEDSGKS